MGIVVGFGYKTFNGFKLDGIAGEGLVFVRNPRFFKKAGFRQNKKEVMKMVTVCTIPIK